MGKEIVEFKSRLAQALWEAYEEHGDRIKELSKGNILAGLILRSFLPDLPNHLRIIDEHEELQKEIMDFLEVFYKKLFPGD